MLRTHWLPEAKLELLGIVRWYEDQSSGLGGEFLDELEPVLENVRRSPRDYPKWEFSPRRHDVRRASLNRFPHRVMFVVQGDEVWIAAIQHPSRSPKYWTRRLRQIRPRKDSE